MPELGMELVIEVRGFADAKLWIDRALVGGVLRCLSPNRTGLCEQAALSVFWQDQAEWYPCCDAHREYGEQWSGSTRWNPYEMSLLVIPEKAGAWMEELAPEYREKIIKVEEYERSTD